MGTVPSWTGIGHAYPTARRCNGAGKLHRRHGDPTPAGAHHRPPAAAYAYWPLSEPTSVFTWKLIVERFKRLCKDSVLADRHDRDGRRSALRVPGTTNWKRSNEPRPQDHVPRRRAMTIQAFSDAVGFDEERRNLGLRGASSFKA